MNGEGSDENVRLRMNAEGSNHELRRSIKVEKSPFSFASLHINSITTTTGHSLNNLLFSRSLLPSLSFHHALLRFCPPGASSFGDKLRNAR